MEGVYAENILLGAKQLFDEQLLLDATLTAGEVEVKCHSVVLAAGTY